MLIIVVLISIAFSNPINIIIPLHRNTSKYYNPSAFPCGNSSKGWSHALFSPSSFAMFNIQYELLLTNATCSLSLGNGLDTPESFEALLPTNIQHKGGIFDCGK